MWETSKILILPQEEGDTVRTARRSNLNTLNAMMVRPKGSNQQVRSLSEMGAPPMGLPPRGDHVLQDNDVKFAHLLVAVQDLEVTLELKLDTINKDMGHMHEEHNKLKARVSTCDVTIKEMQPVLTDAQTVLAFCSSSGPYET
ncbi:hypothetical protein NDU88_003442 [Pleurodeles waltl]|uniref:Uncharacterized protein n=1 Tax=Pleurodeles waltl TaxID=8319 RepID=A0AAV7UDC0_PLEWA|nr:hypothetical protein NDU88_003442 [Pleurodeles waltl]